MAKAKTRRRVRDTWKEKSWYTIKTPVNFEEKLEKLQQEILITLLVGEQKLL